MTYALPEVTGEEEPNYMLPGAGAQQQKTGAPVPKTADPSDTIGGPAPGGGIPPQTGNPIAAPIALPPAPGSGPVTPTAPVTAPTTTPAAPPAPAPGTPGGIAAQSFSPTGYNPTAHVATTRDVDAETETVAGQLNRLLDENSPVLQQARARAMAQSNSRGLMNSSMAATAGEDAVISNAREIAAADANTYTQKSRDNQGALNNAGQFNAGNETESDRFMSASENEFTGRDQAASIDTASREQVAGIDSGARKEQAGLNETAAQADAVRQQESDARRHQYAQESSTLQSQLNTQAAERMAAVNANYNQITNGNAAASAVLNDMNRGIAQILSDPNIPAANKQGLIDQLITSSLRTASLIGGVAGIDLRGILGI